MNKAGQTIGLFMIVRNERHVLSRCLKSVRPLVDHWTIVDTGSDDGTQDAVCELMNDIPGRLIERPWVNFGHNRTESIQLAREKSDYLLTLDADEYFDLGVDFKWPDLIHDAYDVLVESDGTNYSRTALVRSALFWRYEGVLHEYITCDHEYSRASMAGIRTIRLLEGARSRDHSTYSSDALILEEVLQRDPTNTRNTFYLAQSYRDAGDKAKAIEWYRRRSSMGGYAEEVWFSLYQIARLQQQIDVDWVTVCQAYLTAFSYRPHRVEPLYRIGLFHQHRKEYATAMVFFSSAIEIPYPTNDRLFVESDVYRFLVPLEYAVCCYWLGLHHEALRITDLLLANDGLSSERREHLLSNRRYSESYVHGIRH